MNKDDIILKNKVYKSDGQTNEYQAQHITMQNWEF